MPADAASAKSIFLQAVEQHEPAGWSRFLDEVCGSNCELRREIEALLKAHLEARSFLEAGVAISDQGLFTSRVERCGNLIGPYKLLEEIGQGGMGAVYRAEQQHPVRRQVALKIIKPGMDSRQVIARFEAERQALSLMDHPNIARVLDAGTTEHGRPYFVMELVKGQPITGYCDSRHLAPRRRLELFVSVCQAIQHAHQKGIIHRDIKPSNVLIAEYDGTPVAKVIDFGIAKATSQPLTEKTMFTGLGQIIGTPEYMSPEQACVNQLDIDTRSDVYSLGVLLYELLTGTTPFDRYRLRTAAFDEMLRIIREEEPPKPSTRLLDSQETLPNISVQRQMEPEQLTRFIRGELDWIVMKSLEKDRGRRYETADNLAADVQRYLKDEPVDACPPTLSYRLRKLARRNKSILATSLLLLLMLLGAVGGVAAAIGWAVRNRTVLQQQVTKDRETRRTLIEREAGQAIDDAARAMEHDRLPEAVAHVRRAEGILSSGEPTPALAEQIRAWRQAIDMAQQCENIRLERVVVTGETIDWAKSDRAYREAFERYGIDLARLLPDLAAERIHRSAIRHRLIAALDDWFLCKSMAKLDDRAQLDELIRTVDTDPLRAEFRAAFARRDFPELIRLSGHPGIAAKPAGTVCLLASMLNSAGVPGTAVRLLEEAQQLKAGDFWINFDLARNLIALEPPRAADAVGFYRVAASLRPDNAMVYQSLGFALWRDRKPAQAAAVFRQSLAYAPNNPITQLNLGVVTGELGKVGESAAFYRKALELNPDYVRARMNLAITLEQAGDTMGALSEYREVLRKQPQDDKLHDELASHLDQLSASVTTEAQVVEARQVIDEFVRLQPTNAAAHVALGTFQLHQRQWEEARQSLQHALTIRPNYVVAHSNLAWIFANCPEPRMHDLNQALHHAQLAVEADPRNRLSWNHLGAIEYRTGRWQKSIETLERAVHMPGALDQFHRVYLVLSNWRLGQQHAALRHWVEFVPWADSAGPSMQQKSPLIYEELVSLRAEAESLLGDFRDLEAACREILRLDPASAVAWFALGSRYAQSCRWGDSEAAFRQAFALDDPADFPTWLAYACALMRAGDVTAYRQVCQRMASRFEDSHETDPIAFLAHTCVVGPDALGDVDRIVRLAELRNDLTIGLIGHQHWSTHVLGLAYFRAGQSARAITALEAGQKVADLQDDIRLSNYLALTLAYQQAGRNAEATQSFYDAEALMKKQQCPTEKQPLSIQVLFREAESALHPQGSTATVQPGADTPNP